MNVAEKRVLIIQETLRQYRLPFFERLAAALNEDGIRLRVAYSPPNRTEALKGDDTRLDSGIGFCVRAWRAFGGKLVFQPLAEEIARANLVITEQANRLLMNHYLLLLSSLGAKRFAYWGHGWNRQGVPNGFRAWYKRKMLRRAHWWFAYTAGTARYLVEQGYPAGRITNVQNATDTAGFRRLLAEVTEEERLRACEGLGIRPGATIGLFCGGLYPEKRLGFLLESARKIRARVPEFELLVIGGGVDRRMVEAAAWEHPWVHSVGPKFGREKAVLFSLASVFLNPGLIGLGVLDAFCAGLPVLTTDFPGHSPEIEYIQHGANGLITPHGPAEFADAAAALLMDSGQLRRLRQGAQASAGPLTVEAMVENFRQGILQCLGS